MAIKFEAPPHSLFFKNPRPLDPRWGEFAKNCRVEDLEHQSSGYVLTGYPDDEGVRRNHGRTGAAEAPDRIRSQFYKFAAGVKTPPPFYDIGNLKTEGSLEERRQGLEETLLGIQKKKHFVFSLGGGHDWAYPDIAAFLRRHGGKKAIVINIDAHLDVRSDEKGVTSGTSFYRLLENFKNMELIQIGIQPYATSRHHYDYAKKKKVGVHFFHEAAGKLKNIFSALARKKRPIFLSIDIDGFQAAQAPGCSAPSPVGLDANEFFLALPSLLKGNYLQGVGIYEVNPKLDCDERTSRLAAAIMQKVIMCREE